MTGCLLHHFTAENPSPFFWNWHRIRMHLRICSNQMSHTGLPQAAQKSTQTVSRKGFKTATAVWCNEPRHNYLGGQHAVIFNHYKINLIKCFSLISSWQKSQTVSSLTDLIVASVHQIFIFAFVFFFSHFIFNSRMLPEATCSHILIYISHLPVNTVAEILVTIIQHIKNHLKLIWRGNKTQRTGW